MKKLFLAVVLAQLLVPNIYGQLNYRIQTFLNPDSLQNWSMYGGTVKLSADGTTLAISARQYDLFTGIVEVYERAFQGNSEFWAPKGQVLAGLEEDAMFGRAIDLSEDGNRMIIGAPGRLMGISEDIQHVGYFQVYDYNEGLDQWQEVPVNLTDVNNIDPTFNATGRAVAITGDGNRIVVGSPETPVGGIPRVGAVEIYDFNPISGEFDYLTALTPMVAVYEGMQFGKTIDMTSDGSVIVVSAPKNINAGVAYGRIGAYRTNDGINYVNAGYVTKGQAGTQPLAIAVVNGTPVLVLGLIGGSGIAMYEGVGDPLWSLQPPYEIVGPANSLGRSVDINSDGDLVAGLVPAGTVPAGIGGVRFFEMDGAFSWSQVGAISPLGLITAENLGVSVSISDQVYTNGAFYLAAGAPQNAELSPPPFLEMQPYAVLELSEPVYSFLPTKELTQKDDGSMIIYPNPVTDGILYVGKSSEARVAIIVNTQNEKLLEAVIDPGSEGSLNLQRLAPGIYYIKFYDSSQKLIKTERVVVQ